MKPCSRCVEALRRAGAHSPEMSRLHQVIMQVGGGREQTATHQVAHFLCLRSTVFFQIQMNQIHENLFNIKLYHTPPGLRSLTRVFILVTPWLFGCVALLLWFLSHVCASRRCSRLNFGAHTLQAVLCSGCEQYQFGLCYCHVLCDNA
jgi:hypothetical protein